MTRINLTKKDIINSIYMQIGFSKKIIFRNKAKLKDDIYVTGNLGDSFAGLNILNKR